MKRRQSLQYILIFITAQVAWLSLVGLWIFRYVSAALGEGRAGGSAGREIVSSRADLAALVGGLVLLVAVSVGMSLLYARLNSELKITRLYDAFIANVTHELKSPLASIQLAIETLQARRLPAPRRREFLALMARDTHRLNGLINAILEIAGLEQKKVAHHFEVCAAEEVVRSLASEAAEQFNLPARAVRVRGSAPCRCVVDRNALRMVFNNLFDNAVKYSPGKPDLLVRFACASRNLVVDFTDRGIGISPREQKRVFEKFHRVHDRDAPSVKGTGLGLYWVREIIRMHGGRVSVASGGRGLGSTFRIELPVYRTHKKRHIENLLKLTQKMRRRRDAGEGDGHA